MHFLLDLKDLGQNCEHSADIANNLSEICEQIKLWTNGRFQENEPEAPDPPTLLFFWKRKQGKPGKNKGFSLRRPLKSLETEGGKTAHKRKNKEKQGKQKKGNKNQGLEQFGECARVLCKLSEPKLKIMNKRAFPRNGPEVFLTDVFSRARVRTRILGRPDQNRGTSRP